MSGTHEDVVVLKGRIENYSAIKQEIDFLNGPRDDELEGAASIGAALTGHGSMALGNIGLHNHEAQVVWVSFTLDGTGVDGWLWRDKLQDGDQVEVVAEKVGDNHYRVLGVVRPGDRLVVLFPHLRRGTKANVRHGIKSWFVSTNVLLIFLMIVFSLVDFFGDHGEAAWNPSFVINLGLIMAVLIYSGSAVVSASRLKRQKRFCVLSERVFKALGWANAENIDLPQISKSKAKPSDQNPGEFDFSLFYFRY